MRNEKGFTLIELLVVVAIIGILAAIAIPQFAEYRARGFDARAKSDLRNVSTAEEAYFADYEVYKACGPTTAADGSACNVLPGVNGVSNGTILEMELTTTANGFRGTASHGNGTGVTCSWNSTLGGLTGCS